MSLIDIFSEPQDVLRKVAYEGNLLLWLDDSQWLAYTLFNFCVTAHSLRDWCLKYLCIQEASKEIYHKSWNQIPSLVVTRDIANSTKHFGLKKTSSIDNAHSSMIDLVPIYSEEDFDNPIKPLCRPSYEVSFADGSSMQLFELVRVTYKSWLKFFQDNGIPHCKPDNEDELILRPDLFQKRN